MILSLLKKRFHPFAHSSFRLFFFAQSFSLIGTWSHELARSWLVLDMAGTTVALGTLLLCSALPGLFLTLHGGMIADRADARKLLFITKTVLAASALLFFYLTITGQITLWMIFIFAFIEGFVNSFDGPAFTSMFGRTVPRADFQQALAIQSTSFHVARMLGPAIAGIIMAWKGPAYVFLFDAISYIGVIFVMSRIQLREKEPPKIHTAMPTRRLIDGVLYFFREPATRYKVTQYLFSVIIIVPMANIVFRSYLKQKFSLSPEEFGYLFSFPAMGAMIGAVYLMLAALKKPIQNLIFGVPLLVVSLLSLIHANTPQITAALLGISGFFTYLNIASVTQSVQIETPDEYRGRLGALFTLGFSSLAPLMSYPIGYYTDLVGFDRSIRDLTVVFAVLSILLAISNFLKKPRDVL
jgi:MFS family permease